MSTRTTQSIAVLGMGAMGRRIARRLLDAGHPVTVWNRSPAATDELVDAGARRSSTPAEAATGAEVVLSMVRDDEASREVWLAAETGAAHGLGESAIAIECSTLTPRHSGELIEALSERCRHAVVSPVLGSRPQAEAGKLVALLGGAEPACDAAQSVLEAISARVERCGSAEQAAVCKLSINAYFATQVAMMAEVLTRLRGAGLADDVSEKVLSGLPVVAPALEMALNGMTGGAFAPQFPIELVEKDLGYFVEGSTTQTMAGRSRDIYRRALDSGLGDLNLTGVLKLYDG